MTLAAEGKPRPGRFGPYGGRYVPETLIAAITEPGLRRQLLDIALELAQADRHVSEGEGVLLRRLQRAWAPENTLIAA